MIKSKVHRRR